MAVKDHSLDDKITEAALGEFIEGSGTMSFCENIVINLFGKSENSANDFISIDKSGGKEVYCFLS